MSEQPDLLTQLLGEGDAATVHDLACQQGLYPEDLLKRLVDEYRKHWNWMTEAGRSGFFRPFSLLVRAEEAEQASGSCLGSYRSCVIEMQKAGIPCNFGKDGKPTTADGMGRDLADCVKDLCERLKKAEDLNADLLEACKTALCSLEEWGDGEGETADELRAAIAKAEGR